MAIRAAVQVTAGFLAGAVMVGFPTWAVASQDDGASKGQADTSQMMSGAQSRDQMMSTMSKMMKDPAMRKDMASMMSEAMGKMSGKGMGKMSGMGMGGASSGATQP